jgi:hypothetical protein
MADPVFGLAWHAFSRRIMVWPDPICGWYKGPSYTDTGATQPASQPASQPAKTCRYVLRATVYGAGHGDAEVALIGVVGARARNGGRGRGRDRGRRGVGCSYT